MESYCIVKRTHNNNNTKRKKKRFVVCDHYITTRRICTVHSLRCVCVCVRKENKARMTDGVVSYIKSINIIRCCVQHVRCKLYIGNRGMWPAIMIYTQPKSTTTQVIGKFVVLFFWQNLKATFVKSKTKTNFLFFF